MKILFLQLKKFSKELLIVILLAIISSFSTMGIPKIMQGLIDTAIPTKDFALIFTITGRMLILTIVVVVSGVFSARFSSYIAMGVGKNMRSAVFEKVQSFSQAQIDAFTTSSLITRTNSDINQVQLFLSLCLRIAILAPVLCICGIVMALFTSLKLSIVLLVAVPILAITIFILGGKTIPLSESLQIELDKINVIIREKLTGVRVIRAFGTNDFEDNRFDKQNIKYTNLNKNLLFYLNLLRPIIELIIGATLISVMVVSYVLSKDGNNGFSAGMVMAMIQYIMLIMVAITLLTIVFLYLPKATTCAKRANEVVESISEIEDSNIPLPETDKKGYVTFKNVSFTYKGASVPAIKDLSFEAKPGETTAIIGGTGMGKSTIVNLIPRLYDVTSGEVLVDDINVKNYKLADLRKKIGMVPQKALLFKGTIDSNLAFGDENPSEERIEKAAEIAQSMDFIMKKPKGFGEEVAQGGTNFSGGQKQRLCIARAIVRKPEIYIFDDSFSALDLKTDKILRETLKKETGKDATTIIIAQRVSTILDADRIIVVEKGEVAGIGTHHELLASCKVYQEIVASQMSKEEMER